MNMYEAHHSTHLREQAITELYDHIKADDRFTKCISIGPVGHLLLILLKCSQETEHAEDMGTTVALVQGLLVVQGNDVR